jgi:hypothetical protein
MYKTNLLDARREAHFINRKFFNMPHEYLKLRIRKLENVWAYAEETEDDDHFTVLHTHYPDYRFFRNVLAHELIHQWQYYHKLTGTHDKKFFTWRKPMLIYGYNILKEY